MKFKQLGMNRVNRMSDESKAKKGLGVLSRGAGLAFGKPKEFLIEQVKYGTHIGYKQECAKAKAAGEEMPSKEQVADDMLAHKTYGKAIKKLGIDKEQLISWM